MSAVRKPGIPSPRADLQSAVEALKENVEIITGVRSGVKPIAQLATTAVLADCISKINEIVVRLNAAGQ